MELWGWRGGLYAIDTGERLPGTPEAGGARGQDKSEGRRSAIRSWVTEAHSRLVTRRDPQVAIGHTPGFPTQLASPIVDNQTYDGDRDEDRREDRFAAGRKGSESSGCSCCSRRGRQEGKGQYHFIRDVSWNDAEYGGANAKASGGLAAPWFTSTSWGSSTAHAAA